MPLKLTLGIRGTAAGHWLGALEGGGGGCTFPPSNASLPSGSSCNFCRCFGRASDGVGRPLKRAKDRHRMCRGPAEVRQRLPQPQLVCHPRCEHMGPGKREYRRIGSCARARTNPLPPVPEPPPPGTAPCVTIRLVVAPLWGPGRSPVLPFACCVGSLRSVGRCGRCSCPPGLYHG